jgi:hypothetical protein
VTLTHFLGWPLAAVLVAAGVLLAGPPQIARATTGDFEISATRGADGAAYLVRGGLQTCDSSNHCSGGLTQPKSAGGGGFANTILQVDTSTDNGFDSGFRGTVSFQVSGLPAGVTSQAPASTTITDSTILGTDPFSGTMFGTLTTLQLSAGSTAPLGNFPLTVTATSGSLSHSVTITVDVVDSLPATTLARLEVTGCAACNFAETFGGTPALDTVSVTIPAPASGTVVTLASSDPPVASVPASVTVPAGSTSASFTITTQPVTRTTAVSFTATLNGQTMGSNQLTVEAPPLVKSLTLSPASTQPNAGCCVSGDVVLNEQVPENSSGVVVALSSSNPAVASVPAAVTITYTSGSFGDDAPFTVTIARNAPAGTVTISASLNGQTTTAQLTILDQITTSSGNWDKKTQLLTVTALTNNPSDTLQVFVSGTTQLIGTMTNLGNGNYQGQFSLPANPGSVDIKSSGGATLTMSIPTVNGDQISSASGNWGKRDHLLTVTAATNNPSDTLQVFVTGTNQLIGTMTNLGNGNYQGQFSLPANPGHVDIKSSGGATLTIPITTVNQ